MQGGDLLLETAGEIGEERLKFRVELCFGQPRAPQIVYLVTESANETIRGDTRILEVLERKDEQAYRNVGDPCAFMNVHDISEDRCGFGRRFPSLTTP